VLNANSLKNLEKGKATRFKSGDQAARENGRKGGKKSQEVQKAKRDAAALAGMLLNLSPKMPELVVKQVKDMGIKEKAPDALTIALSAQMRKALAGDQSALKFMLELSGEMPKGGGQQPPPVLEETLDERRVRKTLDSMTDDQLRHYQELCTMFRQNQEDETEDDDEY